MSTAPKPGPPGRAVVQIPIENLHPHSRNIRADARAELDELAASIRSVGVLQPLLIQRENGRLVIIDGHRRYHAARRAGLPTLPCLPAATGGRRTQVELMLTSAMSSRLKPMDMARAFTTLRDDLGIDVAEIAKRTGYSSATVRDRLALLALPKEAQHMVAAGELTATDATQLARQVRSTRSDSRRDGVVPGARRQGWFTNQHALAATIKAACTHRTERVMVGGVGCGQCWEHAITERALAGGAA